MKTWFFCRRLLLMVIALMAMFVLSIHAATKVKAYRLAVFQVASTAKIVTGASQSAALPNLRVGDHVSIAYDQENGVLVAHHIADGMPHKSQNPRTTSVSVSHHAAKTSVLEHVNGIVRSVNVQAGTLTIAYMPK